MDVSGGRLRRKIDGRQARQRARQVRDAIRFRAQAWTPGSNAAPSPHQARPDLAPAHGVAHCRVVTTESDFYSLEPVWRDLAAHTETVSPFLGWEFSMEWFRHFVLGRLGGATGRFEVVVAFDSTGRALGLAPMFEERSLGQSGLGMTLQPFGRSHSFETMTDEPVVLLRRGSERTAAEMLKLEVKGRARESGWDIAVVLGPRQRPEASRERAFAIPDRLGVLEVTGSHAAPQVLSLPPSWDAFKSRLSKSMRDNVTYYPRKLAREAGPWTLGCARTPNEVAAATDVLIDLHRRRSESRTGVPHTNHIATEVHASFLRRWFRRMAWRRQIAIITLEVGGEIIGAQAFLEAPGCVSVYYSGYDERWYRHSPLTIITAAMIRDAIERRCGRVEFPPDATAWKSRWGAHDSTGVEQASLYATRLPALVRALARRFHLRLMTPPAFAPRS
jgi:CelD/BcsL family acetyltransferase involved in cellulose biosynthesis